MANGAEPLLVIRELQRMGARVVNADLTKLPPLRELEPEQGYIRWEMVLDGAVEQQELDECFDFVAPAFDGGAAITGYTLRCPPGNQNTVTGSGSPLWLTGLANGNTYANCSVRATNVAGTGAVSNTASVTPLAVPSEVRDAFVVNLDRAGAIGFDTPTLGTPIIDYTAVCTPGPISVTRASAPIVVAALANGTQYECAVTARNNLGSGPPVAVTLRPNDDLFEDSFE